MRCALIDCDGLIYQCGFGSQWKDEEGNEVVADFEHTVGLFKESIRMILADTESNSFQLFLTGDEGLRQRLINNPYLGHTGPSEPQENFRYRVATAKPYKGQRVAEKPKHWYSLRDWILANYDVEIAWGMEADDLMSIFNKRDPENQIIVSRDKDLMIPAGNHYSWEVGKQPSIGPLTTDEIGFLNPPDKGKVKGAGLKFFYAQMIMGDAADNIPGLPKGGPVLAYNTLNDLDTWEGLHYATAALYRDKFGSDWMNYFKEQGTLLWMIQDLHEDGSPVMWVEVIREQIKRGWD